MENSIGVCVIANNFGKHYIVNLSNALARANVEVDLVGSEMYECPELAKRIRRVTIRGKGGNISFRLKALGVIGYYVRFLKYVRKSRMKIYHVQWLRFNLFEGVFLNLFLRLLGKKVIYTAHNVLPHNGAHLINRLKFAAIYRSVDRIVVHTHYLKKRIVDEFDISGEKISVIAHGLYEVRTNSSVDKMESRRILGVPPDAQIILFFGSISEYKGLDLLIEAFSHIRENNPGAFLIIAGKVSPSFETSYKKSINIIKAEYSKVINGFIPDEDIEYLFKASDLVVLPYREASQSGVLLMAYSYGRPVIAPRIGEFPVDISDGRTGHLFKMGDAEDLGKALSKALAQPHDLYNESEILQYAKERYDWNQSATQMVRIYEECFRRN